MPINTVQGVKIYDFSTAICDPSNLSTIHYVPSSIAGSDIKVEKHQAGNVTVLGEYAVNADSVTNVTSTDYRVQTHFPSNLADADNWGNYVFNGASTFQEFTNTYYGFGRLLIPGDTIENVVEIRTIQHGNGKKSWKLYHYNNLITPIAQWTEGLGSFPTIIEEFEFYPSRVSALGLNEAPEEVELVLFPSPTNDAFQLIGPSTGISTVRLFDASGRLALEQQHMGSSRIDVSSLKNGVYNVVVTNRESRLNSRVVVRR